MPKEKAPSKCLSIIMIDSVVKANKKYYPLTMKMQYIQEKIKIENCINEDLENSESDSEFTNEAELDIDSNNETESDTE